MTLTCINPSFTYVYILDTCLIISRVHICSSPSSKLQSMEDAGGVMGFVVGASVVVIMSAQLTLSLK